MTYCIAAQNTSNFRFLKSIIFRPTLAMRSVLPVWPKCSYHLISLNKSPLKIVLAFKRTARVQKLIRYTPSMRMKGFKHIAWKVKRSRAPLTNCHRALCGGTVGLAILLHFSKCSGPSCAKEQNQFIYIRNYCPHRQNCRPDFYHLSN